MKKLLLLTFLTLSLAITAFAADVPQFKDFPVAGINHGENAPVKLTTPEAREFRTRLTEAAREKPNFAGYYILTRWGCGSGCIQPAIIDAKTGRVFMVPFTVVSVGEKVIDPVQFQLDSRLLIVNGSRNDQPENGTFYYRWDRKRLELIK